MIVWLRARLIWLVLPLLGAGLAGCWGSVTGNAPPPSPTSTQTSSGGFADRMSSTLFGPPARAAGPTGPQEIDCPTLDVRQGASTITVYGPGEHVATNVRYQANVGDLARECSLVDKTVTMKVGLQGRIVIGPAAAGSARMDVPVRFALVQEGPNPKTIWTQLYRIPVEIPAGQINVTFTHVEPNISFPNPGDAIHGYVLYAGFDREGLKERQQPRGRRANQARR